VRHRSHRRLHLAAFTSGIAVLGAVATGLTSQQPARASTAPSKVTFTSQRAAADVVAHYTVTPATRAAVPPATSASDSGSQDQLPDRNPKGPGSDSAARTPGSAAATGISKGPGDTARLAASFMGQQGSSTTCSYFAQGCNPPDQGLAASPNFILQGVNTQWEVLNTTGQVQSGFPVSGQAFFGVPDVTDANGQPCDVSHGSQPFLSDPRAVYDTLDHRFIASMLQVENGLGIAPDCVFKTVYFIAVSQTSDPTGSWNVYEFDMSDGSTFAADYTQIGFNGQAVFFSANMFNTTGPGFYAEVFEANLSQMEKGTDNFVADGFRHIQGTGPGTKHTGPFLADTVQPVQTIQGTGSSPAGNSSTGVFVSTDDGPDLLNGHLCSSAADACRGLIVWNMSNPLAHDNGGQAPTFTGTYLPDTQPFFFPPAADEPTCRACVDALDLRITATPVLKDNTIYAAWETGLDNGTHVVPAIEWAQTRAFPADDATLTSNYFGFSGDAAASFGALMPDNEGNVVMVYERMSHTINPETLYTVRDAGSANFTNAGRLLHAGQASYRPSLCGTSTLPVCRWGDFEATSFDGSGHIWFAGEYTNSHTDPNRGPWFGRNWSTWIGAVDANEAG
jgi:hypothetical protein